MDTLSVWRANAAPTGFAMLNEELTTDVLVIGGGITAVTLALLLAEQGRRVVLLESAEIGSGATGNSTGNLYETLGNGLQQVVSGFGDAVAQQVVTQRREAMAFVEERCRTIPEAAFQRCPLLLWAQPSQQDYVEKEVNALRAAGCSVERATAVPAPLPAAPGDVLVLPRQAQFQPQAYLSALARAAAAAGAGLHEHSRVLEIDTKAKRAVTASGAVHYNEVVHATHTPKGIHMVHAEMPVHREYGIAFELAADALPAGIYWWKATEGLSVRTVETGGRRYVVCVGQEHKVGIHNAKASLLALETLAQRHFGEREVTHRWSAQNYRGADGLPYIGRNNDGFIATGFAADGLTWGTVAARVIAAQLAGHTPEFGELVKPNRLNPVKGAKNILQENVTVVKQLLKDYLTDRQEEKLATLAAGDSAIVDVEGESFAAYRAPDGELFAVSNVCPHMGCKVHWNSVETSWDCPCHGSRFRPDGTVIEGPALSPLKRKQLPALGS
ncbi:MAG TPA: FAD-dependent oxidoreductase [Ramlibacter sp.]|jgi:glycine/D-amino acid oxidase-like deaminating enzyme/nitrite reductase/ring-hydroxylating ferredoxin subunit